MNSSPNSERTRLARELHDGLAQELASLGYRLDQIIGSNNLDNINRTPLRQIRFSISGLINQVRDEIFELRSENLKSFNQQLLDQIQALLADTDITYEVIGEISIESTHKFELLRAIRELVLNAKRHSNCKTIEISLSPSEITVVDDGDGGLLDKENSFGLTGVSERLLLIGAKMKITSSSAGTLIAISF